MFIRNSAAVTETVDTKATSARIEKELGGALHNMAELTKQNAAQNVVGAIRAKRIKTQLKDEEIKVILAIVDASVDQSLSSIGSRVPKIARAAVE